MKVNDNSQTANRVPTSSTMQLSNLSQLEQNKRLAMEKKLKDLDRVYQERATQIKTAGELRLEELHKVNNEQLVQVSQDNEERLQKMANSVNQVKNKIEEEKLMLSQTHRDTSEEARTNFQNRYTSILDQNNRFIDELNQQSQEAVGRYNFDQQEGIKKLVHAQHDETRDISNTHKFKIKKQSADFDQQLTFNETKNRSLLNKQQLENQLLLDHTENEHTRKMQEQSARQQMELQKQMEQFKLTFEDAHKDFLKKYQEVTKNHQDSMQVLVTEADNNIKEIKSKLDKEKSKISVKEQDPFYRSINITPKIKEDENNFYISFPIPDFEKDLVQLSGKGRGVRITYGRNFENEVSLEDGSNSKYSKYESMAKLVPLPSVVDDRKIKKDYKNGLIIFTVPKA
ncbi:MAG: Hsp20 family protein [Oligoflexia bacterium]|nr:Hsp20 family protein [Oligoflexia bacterium]